LATTVLNIALHWIGFGWVAMDWIDGVRTTTARFEDDFIEERRRGLEEFMNKITNHPQCCTDPGLIKFLTVEDMEVCTEAPHHMRSLD
jgi:hypothetical protein